MKTELNEAVTLAPGFADATLLLKVLALNPRFAPAANNLAWILSEHGGDKDKALTLAQTAKEQAPEDPRVSDNPERNVP